MITNFINNNTVIDATWLNKVDRTISEAIGNGTNNPTSPIEVKQNLGLNNVDNTSDANKPISLATQTALDLKADTSTVTGQLALKSDTTTTVTKDTSTGSGNIPAGTTAQRTSSPIIGATRFNTTLGGNETWNGSVWSLDLNSGSSAGQLAGFRNILINADFRINQRAYASAAVLSSGVYGHDRWKAGASGGDYSFTQLKSNTQITIAASKSLIQVVEDANVVGGSYVLSWSGTAQARIGLNSATPSGTYAASPILITGQTAGTTMSVEFNTGILSKVQLELGSVATSFEQRPIGLELSLCQRYYEVCYSTWSGNVTNVTNYLTSVPFKVEKLAAPTVSSLSQAGILNGSFNVRSSSGAGTWQAFWGGQASATISAAGWNDSFSASAEL